MKLRIARQYSLFVILSACFIFLTSCWSSEELNQLAIVLGIAIDAGDAPNSYLITAQIVRPSQINTVGNSTTDEKPYANIQLKEDIGISSAMNAMQRPISRRLYIAHNQVIILSEKVARENVSSVLDYFARDRESRLNVSLLIARENAGAILDEEIVLEQFPASHLTKLLESQAGLSYLEETSLFGFLSDMLSPGTVPTVPLIELYSDNEGKKKSQIVGSAVFIDGRMAATLTPDQTRAMQLIKNKVEGGSVRIDAWGSYVSLDIIASKATVTPRIDDGKAAVKIRIRQECQLMDIGSGVDITEEGAKTQIKQLVAQEIIAAIDDLISATKEIGADVCGFGEMLYRSFRRQDETLLQNWTEEYKELEVEYEVEVLISGTGALLQPILPKGER